VSLKCEPSLAEALHAEHSAVRPGYYLNKRHWITVTLDDSLPDELVFGLLEDSYELVVDGLPKRERDRVRLSANRSSEMAASRTYELKRRAERQEETRRRIVEAAVELHTTLGPSRTTVQAIAEKAGGARARGGTAAGSDRLALDLRSRRAPRDCPA
jgi:hypothetical protein